MIWALFFILFPILVIYLCYKYPILDKLGAVVICYLVGIFIGNIGILPTSSFIKIQESIADLSVIIALPILLFSLDVRKWTQTAGKAILAMGLAIVSVLVIVSFGYWIIQDSIANAWHLVGMAIGLYSGGTPNLAAIKTALGVDSTLYLTFHTYDVLAGTIFMMFCLTVAKKMFGRFLVPFEKQNPGNGSSQNGLDGLEGEDMDSYEGILQRRTLFGLAGALALSMGIVAVSYLISMVFPADYTTSTIILGVTTLGIGSSFIPAVRRLKKTFQFGMYIILVFCLTVGSMANLHKFLSIDGTLMFFVMFSVFGSMLLHAVLCKIFKIDVDTFLVVSAAAILSPPFVPAIAESLKNKQVVLTGLTAGILGYAVGNYLGISYAYLIRSLF